jgi:ATP-dependent helicase Lhr and Lhr-like helicase
LRAAEQALLALEGQGSAMIGRFTPGGTEDEWCERGLLARIHRYTLERLRREIEPVTTAVFVRFLFAWQRVAPEQRQLGQAALPAILAQLEGFEAAAGSWESALLPARVADYDPSWLDGLCLSGQWVWGRAEPPTSSKALRSLATTPIVLGQRENWSWLVSAHTPARAGETESEPLELSALGRQIEEQLRRTGPRFFHDLRRGVPTGTELELALSELVAAGRISADSFSGMRGLLPNKRRQRPGRRPQRRVAAGLESAGRWSLLEALEPPPPDQIERWARLLLHRYGVVFRALLDRENAPPWRDLLREYRRLEARGEVRGGRFVQRHAGEQFALPEAIPLLRSERKTAPNGREVCLSACDPLNLLGTLLPGERVTATPSNLLLFRDGLPIAALEGGKVRVFEEMDASAAAAIGSRLRRGPAAFDLPNEPRAALERRPVHERRAPTGNLVGLGSRRAS